MSSPSWLAFPQCYSLQATTARRFRHGDVSHAHVNMMSITPISILCRSSGLVQIPAPGQADVVSTKYSLDFTCMHPFGCFCHDASTPSEQILPQHAPNTWIRALHV